MGYETIRRCKYCDAVFHGEENICERCYEERVAPLERRHEINEIAENFAAWQLKNIDIYRHFDGIIMPNGHLLTQIDFNSIKRLMMIYSKKICHWPMQFSNLQDLCNQSFNKRREFEEYIRKY